MDNLFFPCGIFRVQKSVVPDYRPRAARFDEIGKFVDYGGKMFGGIFFAAGVARVAVVGFVAAEVEEGRIAEKFHRLGNHFL